MVMRLQDEILSRFNQIHDTKLPEIITRDDVLKLSLADQTVLLVTYFDTTVLIGGLETWLRHGAGSLTQETFHAMERIGANVTADVIRQMHDLLAHISLSHDSEMRNTQLDTLSAEQLARLDQLSDIYGDQNGREGDTIFEKVDAYLQSHSG